MRVAQKIRIFGAISLNKIFIKICSHPKISWFFLWPPYFSWKNSVTPQLFHGPPYSEENDSPLIIDKNEFQTKQNKTKPRIITELHLQPKQMYQALLACVVW